MVERVSERRERTSDYKPVKNSFSFTIINTYVSINCRRLLVSDLQTKQTYSPDAWSVAEHVFVEMLLCNHLRRFTRHLGQTCKAYSTHNASFYPFRNLRGVLFFPSSRSRCRYAFQPFHSKDLLSKHRDLLAHLLQFCVEKRDYNHLPRPCYLCWALSP